MISKNFFSTLIKSKYTRYFLITICITLQVIGILTVIGIINYHRLLKGGMGSLQYSYELSEKATLDSWQKFSSSEEMSTSNGGGKTFGEFRVWVKRAPDINGNVAIRIHQNGGEDEVGGFLYIDGNKYSAEIDPETREVRILGDETYQRPKWHWYHWLGFRFPFLYQFFQPFFLK